MSHIKAILFPPLEASNLALQTIEQLRKNSAGGLTTGIAAMDRKVLPMRPGELVSVVGYTSFLKTSWMNWLSKQAVLSIAPGSNELVIRVTWEQSVEEDTLVWLAGDAGLSVTRLARGLVDEPEWKMLVSSAYRRASTPLWVIGHSQLESRNSRRARPRMTMADVALAVEYILGITKDTGSTIRMIVLDYLQRIRPGQGEGQNRREQAMEAVNRAKDLAVSFGCPVVLGSQAGREVLDRPEAFPRIDDGQETSNIEQSSDKMYGLWYPCKTEKPGSMIKNLRVTPNLFLIRVLKQKLGISPLTYALYVDPARSIFGTLAEQSEVDAPPDDDAPAYQPSELDLPDGSLELDPQEAGDA